MNNHKLINRYYFALRVLFLFFINSIIILSFDNVHAELMPKNVTDKKVVSEGVENIDRSMLHDPTKPLHSVNKKSVITETLTLQAIFSRSNSRSAVINGKHVNVGDVVSNHRVVIIGEKIVRLEKNNKKVSLNLRGGMRDVRP